MDSSKMMVRNFLETSMINQADRLFQMDRAELTNKDLMTIELSDVQNIA